MFVFSVVRKNEGYVWEGKRVFVNGVFVGVDCE